MGKVVIYPNESGILSVIHPAEGMDVQEVARKDVPDGVPFLIVNSSTIPEDRTFRNAWEADFSNPHGTGIGADKWHEEQQLINDTEAENHPLAAAEKEAENDQN